MSNPNAYTDAFLTKKPKEGIAIAQARLKDAMALDMEMAEYFKERSQIEEVYAKSLAKASKRLYIMEPGVLGHFAPVWELLLKEFNQIASFHSEMAYKISQEIEKPLRASPSEDYHRLQQLEPIVQSFENKNKLASVKGSIFKKSKSSSSKSGSWENEGVEYLQLHQKLDEARLNRLKTSVEKFEKIQSEQMMKRVEMANITLSAAEVFDIQHDINDFCSVRGRGLATLEHRASYATHSTSSSSVHDQSTPRQRSSTMSSHDSHRSTNKFKSVFMKKKKNSSHEKLDFSDSHSQQHSHYSNMVEGEGQENAYVSSSALPVSEPIQVESPVTSMHNSPPLVDAEGYSIPQSTHGFPNMASDISSRNTSDDLDSDFQSLKLNQRLQIDIKSDAVHEESTEAKETFDKMANMLRERTPTITRRARGRRDTGSRSQTDSSFFGSSPSNSHMLDTNPRAASMVSFSSNDTSTSNPFMLSSSPAASNFNVAYALPQPQSPSMSSLAGIAQADIPSTPNNWLQTIPEVQQQMQSPPQPQYISASILEKTTLTSPTTLLVSGQIMLSYHGPDTTTPIPIHLNHIEGIQELSPNPSYISQAGNGTYMLDTSRLHNNDHVACFAYEMTTSSLALPVRLMPSWKCVDGTSYLMVKHNKNVIVDPSKIKGTVQVFMPDQQVTNVQSTPQGVWDIGKHRLTWQLHDLLEQYAQDEATQQQRLLAKFYIEGHGSPQPIHLNYSVDDSLASGISISCDALDIKHIETRVQSHQVVYN